LLIPEERHDEEPSILERIRRGHRIEHYETVRRRKDGGLIDISLTVSPLADATGSIVGASKIARDISDKKGAQARQELLLKEMGHRVKNAFTLVNGIVGLRLGMQNRKTLHGTYRLASLLSLGHTI
jgi:two-component sensor histidine kinase